MGQGAGSIPRMQHDIFRATTSTTFALLRRAMRVHVAGTTLEHLLPLRAPGGARAPAPRAERAAAGLPRRAEPDASPSRTERQLRVLGVGAPPDRAETGIPGVRW